MTPMLESTTATHADLGTMGATMDNAAGSSGWSEADVQTTDVYDEITNQNVRDYLPAEVQEVLNQQDAIEQAAQGAAAACWLSTDSSTDASEDAAAADSCPAGGGRRCIRRRD